MPSLRGEGEVHDEAICSTVDCHGLSVLAMTKRACNDAIFLQFDLEIIEKKKCGAKVLA